MLSKLRKKVSGSFILTKLWTLFVVRVRNSYLRKSSIISKNLPTATPWKIIERQESNVIFVSIKRTTELHFLVTYYTLKKAKDHIIRTGIHLMTISNPNWVIEISFGPFRRYSKPVIWDSKRKQLSELLTTHETWETTMQSKKYSGAFIYGFRSQL